MIVRLLKEAGVAVDFNKTAFFTNGIEYTRDFIESGRRKVANHTAGSMCKHKTVTTDNEPQAVLRLCCMVRRFVPNIRRVP